MLFYCWLLWKLKKLHFNSQGSNQNSSSDIIPMFTFTLVFKCLQQNLIITLPTAMKKALHSNSRNFRETASRDNSTTRNNSRVKEILLFTPYFDMETWGLQMGSAAFQQCPVSNCRLTNYRDELGCD